MPDDVGIRQSALYFQIKRHSRVIRRTQTHTDTQCVRVYVNVYVYVYMEMSPKCQLVLPPPTFPSPFFFRAHISFIYRVDGGIKLMSFAYRDSRRIVGKCQLTFEASEAGFGFGATNLYRIWLRHGDLKCMLSKYKRRQLFNWSRHFRNILNVYMIFRFQ